MKIVVLDGWTLNPGDLTWQALGALGHLTVHERTPGDLVLDRCAGAHAVFTNKTRLDRQTLARLPGLRYVGVLATGYDVVDVAAARDRGITVTNVPSYGTASVAQATFALLLELTNRVGPLGRQVAQGAWARSPDFCFWDRSPVELTGKTLGIVGYGRIGRAVGRIGAAFGMDVVVATRGAVDNGVRRLSVDALFAAADVVTLHCPLTDETRGIVNRGRLGAMKRGAYLINTARGPLVDEVALAETLCAGRLGGAGLDVLSVEPPSPEHPLCGAPHCIITPHVAWATREARARLMATAVENLAGFLAGNPQNRVW